MADRTLKYRDLLRRLKLFGVTEDKSRGKGSERLLSRIVGGRKYTTTTKCHSESDQKPVAVIRALRRRLKLTKEDGVSDEDFYGK
jgi:ribosomal protein L19E